MLWETGEGSSPNTGELPTAVVLSTPTPEAWRPCGGSPASLLHPGQRAVVSLDPPDPNVVRQEAGRGAERIGLIQPGEVVEILDGPECADGWVWWQVRSLSTGLTGWTAEGDGKNDWLIPAP